MISPRAFLAETVECLATWLGADGELRDPVFGEPTQYGTAYFAHCSAALALVDDQRRREHLGRAAAALSAALDYVSRAHDRETGTGFTRDTGTVSRVTHRDFSWPVILRAHAVLAAEGLAGELTGRIAELDPLAAFDSRAPSNWAAVWLSGEWLRIRDGLSPYAVGDLDTWLAPFFTHEVILGNGFYLEPGYPNSYDLFLRLHLATLLADGYQGRWAASIRDLTRQGLRRSLAMQLSDGSLASAARSTGQTWTIAAEAAFFQIAATVIGPDDPQLADRARAAAWRAYLSLRRWQRESGQLSPVENCLPAAYRVGYEGYTADAHYGSLPLSFLALAIAGGLAETPMDILGKSAVTVEQFPTYRAIAHQGTTSVHVNADPAPGYDAFGIADVTFGPGRFLHFATPAVHQATGRIFCPGIALRAGPGRAALRVVGQDQFSLRALRAMDGATGIELSARARGAAYDRAAHRDGSYDRATMPGLTDDTYSYECRVSVSDGVVDVVERTPHVRGHKTLLVPYTADGGRGRVTHVSSSGSTIRLDCLGEQVEVVIDAEVENVLVLPHGFESRRGLAGLIRVDLLEPSEQVHYRLIRRR